MLEGRAEFGTNRHAVVRDPVRQATAALDRAIAGAGIVVDDQARIVWVDSNLVTPRALVRILQYLQRGANAATYHAALAEPGEENSTLERRLMDLEGRLFAKTGTISNVNSLSGYLVGGDGTEVIFSILSNGSGLSAARMRAASDVVVRVLARLTARDR